MLQRAERRIAGAEIVDREVQAERIELVEELDGAVRILHQGRLRDLQLQRGRRDFVTAEDRADPADEIGLPKLFEREVDGDPPRGRHGSLPVTEVFAHPIEYPFPDFDDEVGFFGQRDEVRRQDDAAFRQLPAHERLGTDNFAGLDVVFRLIVDQELVPFECALEFALGHQPFDRGFVHLRGIIRVEVAAALFGVIQRRIRVADQVDDVRRIVRITGDTHTRGHEHLVALHIERIGQPVEQRACQLVEALPALPVDLDPVHDDGELVTRQTPDYGIGRQRRGQPRRNRLQGLVAGEMSEGIVDFLEMIHVHVQQPE